MVRLIWLALVSFVAARATKPRATSNDTEAAAVENAWKIHAAIGDWTGKVDQKASFALALESAVVAAVIALSDDGQMLASPNEVDAWIVLAGMLLLGVALIYVLLVVTPRLRRSDADREWRENFIYFGHLRNWNEPAITQALRKQDILPVLSRQLVNMSAIAWTKHRRLKWSLRFASVGTALIVVATVRQTSAYDLLVEVVQAEIKQL